MSEARRIYGDGQDMALIEWTKGALDNADVLIVATEWREFRNPDFGSLVTRWNKPAIMMVEISTVRKMQQMVLLTIVLAEGANHA